MHQLDPARLDLRGQLSQHFRPLSALPVYLFTRRLGLLVVPVPCALRLLDSPSRWSFHPCYTTLRRRIIQFGLGEEGEQMDSSRTSALSPCLGTFCAHGTCAILRSASECCATESGSPRAGRYLLLPSTESRLRRTSANCCARICPLCSLFPLH